MVIGDEKFSSSVSVCAGGVEAKKHLQWPCCRDTIRRLDIRVLDFLHQFDRARSKLMREYLNRVSCSSMIDGKDMDLNSINHHIFIDMAN